jgi:hypothetical protein
MAAEPPRESPAPPEQPEQIALGPGQVDHSFVLQAIFQVQRELGAIDANLARVITDTADHGKKLDEIRHTVAFVRGGIYVLATIGTFLLAAVGWLVRHAVISIAAP